MNAGTHTDGQGQEEQVEPCEKTAQSPQGGPPPKHPFHRRENFHRGGRPEQLKPSTTTFPL